MTTTSEVPTVFCLFADDTKILKPRNISLQSLTARPTTTVPTFPARRGWRRS